MGSSTPDHARTTLGGVLTVLDLADEAGVAPVDHGGWGVDALLGTQNRDHGDLDVAIDARPPAAVGAHRFLTQSNVFGYGYRNHGPHTISEDDPLAEPESGPLGTAIATMRSNEEQVFSADEMEYPDAAQAGCSRCCSSWRATRASGTVVS